MSNKSSIVRRVFPELHLFRRSDWIRFGISVLISAVLGAVATKLGYEDLRGMFMMVPPMVLINLLMLRKQEKDLTEKFLSKPPAMD